MSEPFIGEVRLFAGNYAPTGWATCNGQLLSISTNTALFSLMGTTYGGNGTSTFALPDLRGRVFVGPGQGPGLSNYSWGEAVGAETVVLTTVNLPSHTHTLSAFAEAAAPNANGLVPDSTKLTAQAQVVSSRGNFPVSMYGTGAPNVTMAAGAMTSAGGGQAHENRQPHVCLNYIIALQGIFPSRN